MMYNPIWFSKVVAYMLQNVEYNVGAYVAWLGRVKRFKSVMYRRTLHGTKAAKLFRLFVAGGMTAQYIASAALGLYGYMYELTPLMVLAVLGVLLTPFLWALVVTLPLVAARIFIQTPKEKKNIKASMHIFASTKAVKIAVAGSYGKTSMKELLGHVLSSQKNVAITPANKNVASSHALYAKKLKGDEDVLVVEFGEGRPGDVARFTQTFAPDIVVITGIAPAHLDQYASLDEAAKDIFTAAAHVKPGAVYVNADSVAAQPYIVEGNVAYSHEGTEAARVGEVKVSVNELRFTLTTKKQTYTIKTQLIGRHNIGPIVACVQIAEKLGLDKKHIEASLATMRPYEHRMEPRLQQDAWIIDDTYNGNIDGMTAGLALLAELSAKRKIYVTPGLVDQGKETKAVHTALGECIAQAAPGIVVLMKNSVQPYIAQGMQNGGYSGQLRVEDDPLGFYTHLNEFIAAGDVVLLQNDWPDNYA